MIERMDNCIPDLEKFHFKLSDYNRATLNSTFELTRQPFTHTPNAHALATYQ